MANNNKYEYKMSVPEVKNGRAGYRYFITDVVPDQVISCWAVGSKAQVEKLASSYVDRLNTTHCVCGQKLKGIERA